jgi:CheY-like chemotaxis protein
MEPIGQNAMAPKILIVEDNVIIASGIKYNLVDVGYEVVAMVKTGKDAVKKANKLKPDLILMDIKLEGEMDGIQAAERIKKKHNIPIVYLTAYADDEIVLRANGTQPFGYLTKPFNIKELQTIIETSLYKNKTKEV